MAGVELKLSQLPNVITVVRILLVLPTAWLLVAGRYVEALVLMAVAGASDALDGALARRFGWISPFGSAMDPVADKLLVAAMFIVFTMQGYIPVWVAAIVLGRDAVIMTGAGAYRLFFAPIQFAPTLVSKANTATQIVMLLLLLLGLCGFGQPSVLAFALVDPWCFYLLAVLGVVSGVDYVFTWGAKAIRQGRVAPAERADRVDE
ncbi:MAG TPA: CDP-alcohol phosphatidyltransferase family protein [Pseudomonadales bacterium]